MKRLQSPSSGNLLGKIFIVYCAGLKHRGPIHIGSLHNIKYVSEFMNQRTKQGVFLRILFPNELEPLRNILGTTARQSAAIRPLRLTKSTFIP